MSTPANLTKRFLGTSTGPDGKRREYSAAWFSPVDKYDDDILIDFLDKLPESKLDVLLKQVSSIFCVQPYFRNANNDQVFTDNSDRALIARIVYNKPADERAQFVEDVTRLIPPGFYSSNRLSVVRALARVVDAKVRSEFVEQARAMMEISLAGIKVDREIDANTWATPFLMFFKYFGEFGDKVYVFSQKAKASLSEFNQEQAALLELLQTSKAVSRKSKENVKQDAASQDVKETSEAALTAKIAPLFHVNTDDHDKQVITRAVMNRSEKERDQFIQDARSLFPKGLHGCNQSAIVETLARTASAEECSTLAKQARRVMEALFLDLNPENKPHLWETYFSRFYFCSDEERLAIVAKTEASVKLRAVQKEMQSACQSDVNFKVMLINLTPELKAQYEEAMRQAAAPTASSSSSLVGFDRHKQQTSSDVLPTSKKKVIDHPKT